MQKIEAREIEYVWDEQQERKEFLCSEKGKMRKPRIMIYDDNTFILTMLNRFFSEMNFEVQCIEQPILCPSCEETRPCADVLITDFNMPLINGIELLNNQVRQGCRIGIKNKAIMSAMLPAEHTAKFNTLAGIFLQKPFCLEELNKWTKECLGRIDLSQPLSSCFKKENHNDTPKSNSHFF